MKIWKKNSGPVRLITLISVGLLFAVNGCSKEPAAEVDPYPEMSKPLRNLQGNWTNASTNNTAESAAIIQGYTIRVRFQEAPDQILQKQNASIDRIDEKLQMIVLNGGTGAWPYELKQDGTNTFLTLRFFATDGWHKMELCRND
ncbi:hypothetical protein P4E94_09480 [Pontiellaceae bacterium B12219]|nr:hypothetical protein [Pontiellaceae bacterium B12219]